MDWARSIRAPGTISSFRELRFLRALLSERLLLVGSWRRTRRGVLHKLVEPRDLLPEHMLDTLDGPVTVVLEGQQDEAGGAP